MVSAALGVTALKGRFFSGDDLKQSKLYGIEDLLCCCVMFTPGARPSATVRKRKKW